MAEAPSSPPAEKIEAPAEGRGQSASPRSSKPDGSPSCPATTPPPAKSSTATAVSSSSSSAAPAAGASGKSSASKSLAITVPARANSDTGAEGGRGDGGCRRSFSQLLAGAMASPLGSSLPMSIVAVPVEGVRVPVVAVPCFIAPAALLESPGFTGQFGITHQAVLASVTAQAQVQVHTGYANSSVSTSTAVTTQPSPTSLSDDNVLSSEAEPQPSSEKNDQSSPIILKTTAGDRFNWRKYGQKQVKNSDNSRSYYRCTQANCAAKKKVECCNDGRVVEVVYKGGHNHDPPEKVKCSKERKRQAIAPFGDTGTSTCGSGEANGNLPSQPKLEQDSGSDTPEQRLHCSSDCEADAIIKTEGDLDEEPDFKRRLTERQLASPSPRFKAAKETKVVIQKASDARSSNDGYKWRKYGQKLVKGNPNPRSYYKCTHVGCPARKHVERDSADAKALIIRYEGKHNHDLPTPKDGSAPAAALLIAAAAAAAATVDSDGCIPSLVSSEKKHSGIQQQPDAKSAVVPSEKVSKLEGDKTLESAQALLSIGLKPTPEDGRRAETDVDPRPLFEENHVVSVQNS